uniref:3-oxo-5alpha-steroid 4-dehydrogenase (NADP(+)) n=1 Tax=Echeneis naucrates TaxID=173247 RepID=A0A665WAC5_ECHNA
LYLLLRTCKMHCYENLVNCLTCWLILMGVIHLLTHRKIQSSYGRHMALSPPVRTVPARLAWFIQEVPALVIPLLLMVTSQKPSIIGIYMVLGTFSLHYFQRTVIYSLLIKGKPFPLSTMVAGAIFCILNGSLQGHYLLHCSPLDDEWSADYRCRTGLVVFYVGMAINIHSDYILRNLRKPGEEAYKIPTGGLFEYVSGANYLGEIIEWFGFALATWSLPALAFALFTLSFIGPRAYYHHRFYQEKFKDYPKIRKALIPFII